MKKESVLSQRRIDLVASEWVGKMDRTLSAEDAAALDAWLRADPRHAEALDRFQATWRTFAQPRPAPATEQVETLVKAFDRRRSARKKATVLSLLVVTIGLAWVGLELRRPPVITPQVIQLAFSGESSRLLDDGTRVDTSSGCQVEVAYSPTVRRIDLTGGEAFFQIAHDSQRPFIVRAGPVTVRAVGTAFSIDFQGEAVEVIVTEGQVAVGRVASDSATGPISRSDVTQETLLRAGVRLVFSQDDDALSKETQFKVNVLTLGALEKRLPGRVETMEFSNDRLEEVAKVMSRHSRADFFFEDLRLRDLRVSARLRAGDVDAFVHLMSVGLGLRVERQSEAHFVIHKEL